MRKRTWGIACAALVALLGAGVPVGVHCAADARWAEMEQVAARLEREWQARDFTRAAVGGAPIAESAFARYAQAMALAKQLTAAQPDCDDLLRLYRREKCGVDAAAFAARWQPVCELLHEGSRCTDARPLIDWSKGFDNERASVVVMRYLVDAVCVVQRRLLAAGDADAAVDLSLAAHSFATAWLRAPMAIDQLIGVACDVISVVEWRDEDLRALPAAALRRLGDGLAAIERCVPESPDGSGELLLLACGLRRVFSSPAPAPAPRIDGDLRLRDWRFCWSERWLAADAVCAMAPVVDEAPAPAWPDRTAQIAAGDERLARGANPLVDLVRVPPPSLERSWRDALGAMRLLRVAIALHLGEGLLVKDPFARGSVTVERQGGLARVAYTSPDGRPGPRQRLVQLDAPANRGR